MAYAVPVPQKVKDLVKDLCGGQGHVEHVMELIGMHPGSSATLKQFQRDIDTGPLLTPKHYPTGIRVHSRTL